MIDDIAGPEQARRFTRIALNAWKGAVGRFDDVVAAITDEELEHALISGNSRLLYLIGHLTALHDRLLSQLGLGDRRHSELDADFAGELDVRRPSLHSATRIRALWNEVNHALLSGMERLTPEEWLEAPKTVADEASRLRTLIRWTDHVKRHASQIEVAGLRLAQARSSPQYA